MEDKIRLTTDINGHKVCEFEDDKIAVTIVLKKDYSDVEDKLRDANILKDIEEALVSLTADFIKFKDKNYYKTVKKKLLRSE